MTYEEKMSSVIIITTTGALHGPTRCLSSFSSPDSIVDVTVNLNIDVYIAMHMFVCHAAASWQ